MDKKKLKKVFEFEKLLEEKILKYNFNEKEQETIRKYNEIKLKYAVHLVMGASVIIEVLQKLTEDRKK